MTTVAHENEAIEVNAGNGTSSNQRCPGVGVAPTSSAASAAAQSFEKRSMMEMGVGGSGFEPDRVEPREAPATFVPSESWTARDKGACSLGLFLFGHDLTKISPLIGSKTVSGCALFVARKSLGLPRASLARLAFLKRIVLFSLLNFDLYFSSAVGTGANCKRLATSLDRNTVSKFQNLNRLQQMSFAAGN